MEAEGQIENLQARLTELENGSRPEEISRAGADVDRIKADLANARIARDRTRSLVSEGILTRQMLDDAEAKHDSLAAQVRSAENSYSLVRAGPRTETLCPSPICVISKLNSISARTTLPKSAKRTPQLFGSKPTRIGSIKHGLIRFRPKRIARRPRFK